MLRYDDEANKYAFFYVVTLFDFKMRRCFHTANAQLNNQRALMTRRSASNFLSDRVQADGVDKNVWVEFVGMAMKHKGFVL